MASPGLSVAQIDLLHSFSYLLDELLSMRLHLCIRSVRVELLRVQIVNSRYLGFHFLHLLLRRLIPGSILLVRAR